MLTRRNAINGTLPLLALAAAAAFASGCGGSGASTPAGTSGSSSAATSASPAARVLPVAKNPITNSSSAPGLTITKALVENNVAPDTGKGVADHLEIALKNSTSKPVDQVAVYFKITDTGLGKSEGYFTKLSGLIIKPGATRVVHFDNTVAADHYPVNRYSLFYTDKGAMTINVSASSRGLKVATFTVKKAAGGAEAGVE